MSEPVSPDVTVYVCHTGIPDGGRLPRQWDEQGAHVVVREVPCSGKMDGQYLLHAMEGGGLGFCVVACSNGECHLAQGNYRARIRVRMVRRLLAEIGLDPERAQLVQCSPNVSFAEYERSIREAVKGICSLGEPAIPRQSGKSVTCPEGIAKSHTS